MGLIPLLLAAVSTASSPTMSTPGERPQCVAPVAASVADAGVSDESDAAEAPVAPVVDDVAAGGECDPPPPPSTTVLDCNDPRISPYLDEMIGRCDMPRSNPSTLAVARPSRGAGRLVCDSMGCSRGPSPLRPVQRLEDASRPLVARGIVLIAPSHSTRIAVVDEPLPPSIDRDPLERPPRR